MTAAGFWWAATPGTAQNTPAPSDSERNPSELLETWTAAQSQITTWSADFTQIRRLKALTQPLTEHGHVWFSAPHQFRWELGNPPKTIAIRQTNALLVVYPKLKRAERYPIGDAAKGQWSELSSLLDAGFPRNDSEFRARYNVVSQSVSNGIGSLTLEPRSAGARRVMRRVEIAFSIEDFTLKATELQFADGSSMRNEFTNVVLNPNVDPGLFQPILGPDFTVVEPIEMR